MLTLTSLRERRDSVITCLAKRGIDATESVDRILSLDIDRRGIQKELDDPLAQSNILNQSALAMVAQANQAMANILTLLN